MASINLPDLDHQAFVDMLCGTQLPMELFNQTPFQGCGRYDGSHDTWIWDADSLLELSDEQLFSMCSYIRTFYHEHNKPWKDVFKTPKKIKPYKVNPEDPNVAKLIKKTKEQQERARDLQNLDSDTLKRVIKL